MGALGRLGALLRRNLRPMHAGADNYKRRRPITCNPPAVRVNNRFALPAQHLARNATSAPSFIARRRSIGCCCRFYQRGIRARRKGFPYRQSRTV